MEMVINLLFIQHFLNLILASYSVSYFVGERISDTAVSDLRQETAGGEALTVPLSQVFPEIEDMTSHDEMPVKR